MLDIIFSFKSLTPTRSSLFIRMPIVFKTWFLNYSFPLLRSLSIESRPLALVNTSPNDLKYRPALSLIMMSMYEYMRSFCYVFLLFKFGDFYIFITYVFSYSTFTNSLFSRRITHAWTNSFIRLSW